VSQQQHYDVLGSGTHVQLRTGPASFPIRWKPIASALLPRCPLTPPFPRTLGLLRLRIGCIRLQWN